MAWDMCSDHLRGIFKRLSGLQASYNTFFFLHLILRFITHEASLLTSTKQSTGHLQKKKKIEVFVLISFTWDKTCFDEACSFKLVLFVNWWTLKTKLLAFYNIAYINLLDMARWLPDEWSLLRLRDYFNSLVFMAADIGRMDWMVAWYYGSRNETFT